MEGSLPVSVVLTLVGVLVGVQTLAMLLALLGVTLWFNHRLNRERQDCAEEIRRLDERSRDEVQRQREELRNGFERERLQLEAKMLDAFRQREQMYQELRLHAREARAGKGDSLSIRAEGDVSIGGDLTGRDKVTG